MSDDNLPIDLVSKTLRSAKDQAGAMNAKGVVIVLFNGRDTYTLRSYDLGFVAPRTVARTLRTIADDECPHDAEVFDRASTIAALRDLLDKLERA